MKKQLVMALGLTLGLCAAAPSAYAHGSSAPEHGGVVKVEHDLVFELVRTDSNTSVYIKDHGEPYPTDGLTGTVMVLAAGGKNEAPLSPAGNNKMTADIVIADGAKVLVKVKSGDHHPVTVRYSF
ncbi:hypothetical protein LJ739_02050 [Aestuariibacter halophilus]|uniref:Uncharacterized protein n=1 Tax=Fluctibacter halophilus TaxID=226011 RepID=A0ABS8G3G2_9ALTE|nr:hypothetical protein [Aestuariibacter halophilus]MCC2615023.1 hypothetical protein [Aestuariibacter halophilus]